MRGSAVMNAIPPGDIAELFAANQWVTQKYPLLEEVRKRWPDGVDTLKTAAHD